MVERGPHFLWIFATGNYQDFEKTFGKQESQIIPCVLAVRDPRDALVSQYYSWKFTHKNNSPRILAAREELLKLDERSGLKFLIEEKFFSFGNNISKWKDSLGELQKIHILRYEEVLDDFSKSVGGALTHLGIDYTDELLIRVEQATSFKAKTSRKPGEEDQTSHYRKGVAGDHLRLFDDEITSLFNREYGSSLTALGYE